MTDALLYGRYRTEAVAGSGNQGHVWRAVDTRHDRPVAIKIIESSDASVMSEARVLYGLRPHLHLPLLRDDFTEDGRMHLVMDWVDGVDLTAVAGKSGPLDLEQVVELLTPVAAALDHMHAHDPPVVHGDVKPANIIRSDDGRVVLVDLGVAGRPATGSVGYRAPEAARGDARPASDIYSLAATAYALLTGTTPRAGPFADMPQLTDAQADRVKGVLEWGLQVVPERRPRSASTFIEALAGANFSHNLPTDLPPLIGRLGELARLDDLLRSRRMVTIVGPGGAGKTRLAVEAASRLCAFSGGVISVDLTEIRDEVPLHVLRAMGESIAAEAPIEALTERLRRDTRLIVLDNAEHILDETAALCVRLCERCPSIRLLVTSREALGVRGESILRIAGLPTVPEPHGSEAGRMLVARIREIDPTRAIDEDELDAANEIGRLVEGLPLALELAAARAATTGLLPGRRMLSESLSHLGGLRSSSSSLP